MNKITLNDDYVVETLNQVISILRVRNIKWYIDARR